MNRYRALLANHGFRLLWIGSTISGFGDWFVQAAVYLHIYRLTGSAVHVGLLGTFRVLVRVAMGPLAGTAADRLDRKNLMVVSDLIRFILFLVLFFHNTVEVLYGLLLAASVLDAVHTPASRALLPVLLYRKDVLTGNSLLTSTQNIQMFAAPALAGLVIALSGTEIAFAINALTYLLSAAVLCGIRNPETGRRSADGAVPWIKYMTEGLAYIRRSPFLVNIVIASTVSGLGAAVADAMEVVYVDRFLGAAEYGYGLVLSAAGAGALLGSVTILKTVDLASRDRVFAGSMVAAGLSFTTYPLIPSLWFLLPIVFIQTVFLSYYHIARNTMIQERCPEDRLGRVFGFTAALGSSTYLAAKASSGFLAEIVGVASLLAAAGIFIAAGGAVYLVRSSTSVETTSDVPWGTP